jgi:L-threonylcarbamoyladenylate synthase
VSRVRRVGIAELIVSPQQIRELARGLDAGSIAAIPTETFYGLAASPRSAPGVRRVFDAKRRDDGKPLPVVVANREQLLGLGVSARKDLLTRCFRIWPAPLTVVLPLSKPIPASRGHASLAVRVPGLPELVRLLEAVGPLTATSANRAGESPLCDPDEVARAFEGVVDLLVDGGPTPGGRPSTLLDATVDPPIVLRRGAYPWPPENERGLRPC